jgi:hypothetical protein
MANGFLRGAVPTPIHRVLAASPFKIVAPIPPNCANVPAQLDVWGNSTYGDCVTAEEAFKLACASPEIFIPPAIVIAWAKKHGYLNGANLADVMNSMQKDGFQVGGQQYNDGPYAGVNYADQSTLQAAITPGSPVKIAIDANALPSGAGNINGWYVLNSGNWNNTDHCVSASSYGEAGFLFDALKVPLPSNIGNTVPGFLIYTWKTQGFVVHEWITGTCREGWVRKPPTIGVPPLPGPPVDVPMSWDNI